MEFPKQKRALAIYTLSLIIWATTSALAQSGRGFLVTMQDDTLVGQIRPIGKMANPMEKKHFLYQARGQQERKIPASEIREYALVSEDNSSDTPFIHHFAQTLFKGREFWSPVINGKVKLYAIFKNSFGSNAMPPELRRKNSQKIYFLARTGQEKTIQWKKRNYIEISKLLFPDCPKLTDRLGEKHFRFEDVESIVAFYNRLCQ